MSGFGQWAVSPPRSIPPCPKGVNERAHLLRELAERAKALAKAIEDSERASLRRAALEAGESRARITSANAKWATAAEHRERCERNFQLAVEAVS